MTGRPHPIGRARESGGRPVDPPSVRLLLPAILLAAGTTLSAVGLTAVSGWLISRAAEQPPVLFLITATVGVRALGLSRALLRYQERLVAHDAALRWQSAVRLQVYERLQQGVWLGRRGGEVLARVIGDSATVIDRVTAVLIPVAATAVSAAVITVATMIVSPVLGAVLGGGLLLGGWLVPVIAARAVAPVERRRADLRGRLAGATAEVAHTADDLIAFGAVEVHRRRIAGLERETAQTERQVADRIGAATAAQHLVVGALVASMLIVGSGHVADGTLAPVMLAVVVLTPLAVAEMIAPLVTVARDAGHTRAALDRLAELGGGGESARPSTVPVPGPAEPVGPEGAGAISFTGLAVGWPGRPVVADGLTERIGAGERVAVVGPSGVGKTTLAATVLGLIPPRAGLLTLSGRIGYLAQDAYLFDTTITENLRIAGPDLDDEGVLSVLRRVGVDLDPDTAVGEHGARISGGQARRIALARVLVHRADVVVVDEPTEHLDAATASRVLDDLLATTADAAVMIISHDPAVVARCDRVLRIGPARWSSIRTDGARPGAGRPVADPALA